MAVLLTRTILPRILAQSYPLVFCKASVIFPEAQSVLTRALRMILRCCELELKPGGSNHVQVGMLPRYANKLVPAVVGGIVTFFYFLLFPETDYLLIHPPMPKMPPSSASLSMLQVRRGWKAKSD